MSNLPAVLNETGGHARQLARATKAQEKTELAIYTHQLAARYEAEVDQIDSQAIADATKAALEVEMAVLDQGLELAGDSLAKKELVSRMVSLQSKIDGARIARRFGG